MSPPPRLSHRDVLAATARLSGRVRCTPTVPSSTFDGHLKLETLQLTGAYKVRGALHALGRQVERGDRRPVVAASAGNHAAGVAWAARALGLEAVAVVPERAPQAKVARTEALGARVLRHGADFEAAYAEARRLAAARGWRFLHPFDDLEVIAGQGSIGVELLPLRPDVVAVPIGGGGLASGIGTLLRAYGVPVVGVQVQGVDAMARALGGDTGGLTPPETVADGVCVRRVGALTRAICQEVLDDIVLVSEAEVQDAMRRLALHDHVIAEGAGAVAAAALARLPGRRKVAVVSGGNLDPGCLARVMAQADLSRAAA